MTHPLETRDRLVRIESKLSRFMEVMGLDVNGGRQPNTQYTVLLLDQPTVAYGPFRNATAAEIWADVSLKGQLWHVAPLVTEVCDA